jgi:hypothetical protein
MFMDWITRYGHRFKPEHFKAELARALLEQGVGIAHARAATADIQLSIRTHLGHQKAEARWQLVDLNTQVPIHGQTADVYSFKSDDLAEAVVDQLAPLDLTHHIAWRPLPGQSARPLRDPEALAVVIGIERYRAAAHAPAAVADARAFAHLALETMGLPPTQVRVLLNERAGRADIISMLQEWLPRNAKGRVVHLFFAGLGTHDPKSGAMYLLPWDVDLAFLARRGLALDGLLAQLRTLEARAVHVYVDAGFSGRGPRSTIGMIRPLIPLQRPAPTNGIHLFLAGRIDEAIGTRGPHGHFTHAVLNALRGAADQNADGQITPVEIGTAIQRRMAKAGATQVPQHIHTEAP